MDGVTLDRKLYRPCGNFSSRKVAGEYVVINMETGEYHTFNPVGGMIWDAIIDKQPLAEITKIIVGRFDVRPEKAKEETYQFIENLLRQRLLEIVE